MKKNRKATLKWKLCEGVIFARVRYTRVLLKWQNKKVDRIYRCSGFAPAFDYLCNANRRLDSVFRNTRRWRTRADRYFMAQFEGRV